MRYGRSVARSALLAVRLATFTAKWSKVKRSPRGSVICGRYLCLYLNTATENQLIFTDDVTRVLPQVGCRMLRETVGNVEVNVLSTVGRRHACAAMTEPARFVAIPTHMVGGMRTTPVNTT